VEHTYRPQSAGRQQAGEERGGTRACRSTGCCCRPVSILFQIHSDKLDNNLIVFELPFSTLRLSSIGYEHLTFFSYFLCI
jgi:hypothetical protein